MPTQLTVLDVWNGALDHVSEQPINDPMQDNTYSRWIKRNYPNLLDAELRANPWNFAITYHTLTPSVAAPAFRWRHGYQLPTGALRFLPPSIDGKRETKTLKHEIVGDQLYMNYNASGGTPIRCVSRIVEPGRWDPLFAEMLMASLALKMCIKFTAKESYYARVERAYDRVKNQAVYTDALEGSGEPVEQHDIIAVRYR